MGFSLDDSFTFYASYHQNKTNQNIHLVAIWPIFITAIIFLNYTTTISVVGTHVINWASIMSGIYILYYLIVGKLAGFLAAILVALSYFFAKVVTAQDPNAWKLALGMLRLDKEFYVAVIYCFCDSFLIVTI